LFLSSLAGSLGILTEKTNAIKFSIIGKRCSKLQMKKKDIS